MAMPGVLEATFGTNSYTTSTKCCSSSCESVSSTTSSAYARQSTHLSTSTPSSVPRRCGRCRPPPPAEPRLLVHQLLLALEVR